jgi:hypothetical protein
MLLHSAELIRNLNYSRICCSFVSDAADRFIVSSVHLYDVTRTLNKIIWNARRAGLCYSLTSHSELI